MKTESRPGQRRLMRRARRSGSRYHYGHPRAHPPLHWRRAVRMALIYAGAAEWWHVLAHIV